MYKGYSADCSANQNTVLILIYSRHTEITTMNMERRDKVSQPYLPTVADKTAELSVVEGTKDAPTTLRVGVILSGIC